MNRNLHLLLIVTECNEVKINVLDHVSNRDRSGNRLFSIVKGQGRLFNSSNCIIYRFFHGMHILLLKIFSRKWCRVKYLKVFHRLSQAYKNSLPFLLCAFYYIFIYLPFSKELSNFKLLNIFSQLKMSMYLCSECIYVMKMPICMYLSGISIEMVKAVQC